MLSGTHFDVLAHVLTMYLLPAPVHNDFGLPELSRLLNARVRTPHRFKTVQFQDASGPNMLMIPRVAIDLVDDTTIIARGFVTAIYTDSQGQLWPIEVFSTKGLIKAGAMLYRQNTLGGLVYVRLLNRHKGCIVITCDKDFDLLSRWLWEIIHTFEKDGVVAKGPLPQNATVVGIKNERNYPWIRTHLKTHGAMMDFIRVV